MAHSNILILVGITVCLVFGANTQSAENNTECDEDEFKCVDGNGCTKLAYRCDGDKDCSDGSDDSADICKDNCFGLEDRFQCADGTCIKSYHVCTGSPQCPDSSDEAEQLCANCNGDETRFKCAASSGCVPGGFICDSDLDCGEDDPSDEDPKICEENCGGQEDRFQCANKKCTYKGRVCNGKDDCGDGSDESAELCANCNGDTERTKCKSINKCFSSYDRCDGYKDCAVRDENGEIVSEDDTDEENCSTSEDEPVTPGPIFLGDVDVAPPEQDQSNSMLTVMPTGFE